VAVGGIADSGLIFRLTRGRLWIGLLATLLVGIVGLNVVALSFSASSSESAKLAEDLEQRNSALEAQLAGLLSTEELQEVAAKLDLINPPPGLIHYVDPGTNDASVAAKRLQNGDLATADSPPPAVVPVVESEAAATTTATDATTTETVTTDTAPVADPAAVVEQEAVAPETATPIVDDPAVAAPTDAGGVAAP
jgi:hypothetical protein